MLLYPTALAAQKNIEEDKADASGQPVPFNQSLSRHCGRYPLLRGRIV